jgi:hypothetical protein
MTTTQLEEIAYQHAMQQRPENRAVFAYGYLSSAVELEKTLPRVRAVMRGLERARTQE